MSGNFDGPSFVKKEHTSYGLNSSGTYQIPNSDNLNNKNNANSNNQGKSKGIRGGKKIV